jgi:hypothetical protein
MSPYSYHRAWLYKSFYVVLPDAFSVGSLVELSFLAHLLQSDMVSFCDSFSSGVRP